jgi:hypothetical protein
MALVQKALAQDPVLVLDMAAPRRAAPAREAPGPTTLAPVPETMASPAIAPSSTPTPMAIAFAINSAGSLVIAGAAD